MATKEKGIRLYAPKATFKVCKHISINAEPSNDSFPACEYEVPLIIKCNLCKKTYNFAIKVN
jgi:hypothetical protein